MIPHHPHILSLSVLALATVVVAQDTSVSIKTSTPVACLVQSGANSAHNGVAANTVVGKYPNNLSLRAGLSSPYLSAVTLAYPTVLVDGGIGVNFFERAYARGATTDKAGTSASATAMGATFGPHGLTVTFHNKAGTKGTLVFSFRANPGAAGTVRGGIDIDNDSKLDFQTTSSATKEFAATIGKDGTLVVRVDNECATTGAGSSTMAYAWTEMWVGFRPDRSATCTFTNYGKGCGGAAVSGGSIVTGSSRVVTFKVTGAFPNSVVISAWGNQSLDLPLPGTCRLLSNAEAVRLINADAQGNAVEAFTVPVTMVGTSFHQYLPVTLQGTNLVIRASNGVRVDCKR